MELATILFLDCTAKSSKCISNILQKVDKKIYKSCACIYRNYPTTRKYIGYHLLTNLKGSAFALEMRGFLNLLSSCSGLGSG